MKLCFLVAALFFLTITDVDALQEYSWKITKNSKPMSYKAKFVIKKEEKNLGKIVRSGLATPRYSYDLLDNSNALVATGITRLCSLGFFYPWATDIDVYANNELIGSIEGKYWTHSRAKFTFYDPAGKNLASAYLDEQTCDFLFFGQENDQQLVCELELKAFGDVSVMQMKSLVDPLIVDERVLQIFAAFIEDFQKYFIPQPKVIEKNIHHYHHSDSDW